MTKLKKSAPIFSIFSRNSFIINDEDKESFTLTLLTILGYNI